jgi:hypothetical protein
LLRRKGKPAATATYSLPEKKGLKMPKTYMQQVDEWVNADIIGQILADDSEKSRFTVRKAIREKLLESYRNGQSAPVTPKKVWSRQR